MPGCLRNSNQAIRVFNGIIAKPVEFDQFLLRKILRKNLECQIMNSHDGFHFFSPPARKIMHWHPKDSGIVPKKLPSKTSLSPKLWKRNFFEKIICKIWRSQLGIEIISVINNKRILRADFAEIFQHAEKIHPRAINSLMIQICRVNRNSHNPKNFSSLKLINFPLIYESYTNIQI